MVRAGSRPQPKREAALSPATPARILIHPGFHKTGTSSIQHFLWDNRAVLAPHVSLLMLRHLKPVVKRCQGYSHSHNPLILAEVVETMDEALGLYPPQPGTVLLISCEGLSGHCPGWPGVDDYAAAPVTASFLTGYLAERYPGVPQEIVYTTRSQPGWAASAWRHHLMGQRLRQDWPEFAARFGTVDLGATVAEIAAALDPLPVYALSLEDAQDHPLGPGGALIELLNLPEAVFARLRPVPRANPGPDESLAAQLLALNLSRLPEAELIARKARLVEQAGIGGWQRG